MNNVALLRKPLGTQVHHLQNDQILGMLQSISQAIAELPQAIYKQMYEHQDDVEQRLRATYDKLSRCCLRLPDVEDVHDLIYELGLVMKLCQEIIEVIDIDNERLKYTLRLAIIIHDLIKKTRPERFTREELAMIKEAIHYLPNSNRDYIISLDQRLMEVGFNWLVGDKR